MQGGAYAGEKVGGQKRVSTQCEEIIMDTDLFDLKDRRPDSGELFLERRPRRDEGLRCCGGAHEPQSRRQADALHFARRAFWDLLDDKHLARDLKVGDASDGELTNVFRCRLGAG